MARSSKSAPNAPTPKVYWAETPASCQERSDARAVAEWLALRLRRFGPLLSSEYESNYRPWCVEHSRVAVGKGRWSRVMSAFFGPSKTILLADGRLARARLVPTFSPQVCEMRGVILEDDE